MTDLLTWAGLSIATMIGPNKARKIVKDEVSSEEVVGCAEYLKSVKARDPRMDVLVEGYDGVARGVGWGGCTAVWFGIAAARLVEAEQRAPKRSLWEHLGTALDILQTWSTDAAFLHCPQTMRAPHPSPHVLALPTSSATSLATPVAGFILQPVRPTDLLLASSPPTHPVTAPGTVLIVLFMSCSAAVSTQGVVLKRSSDSDSEDDTEGSRDPRFQAFLSALKRHNVTHIVSTCVHGEAWWAYTALRAAGICLIADVPFKDVAELAQHTSTVPLSNMYGDDIEDSDSDGDPLGTALFHASLSTLQGVEGRECYVVTPTGGTGKLPTTIVVTGHESICKEEAHLVAKGVKRRQAVAEQGHAVPCGGFSEVLLVCMLRNMVSRAQREGQRRATHEEHIIVEETEMLQTTGGEGGSSAVHLPYPGTVLHSAFTMLEDLLTSYLAQLLCNAGATYTEALSFTDQAIATTQAWLADNERTRILRTVNPAKAPPPPAEVMYPTAPLNAFLSEDSPALTPVSKLDEWEPVSARCNILKAGLELGRVLGLINIVQN